MIKEVDAKGGYSRTWEASSKDEDWDFGKYKAEILAKLRDTLDELDPSKYNKFTLTLEGVKEK